MAAAIAVTVSMGVMKPLLGKLTMLMGDKYKKIKGLRKVVSSLQHELSDMSIVLEKMDDADELDPQAKKWRKDIIEMSYDIEDYIDDFMARVGEAGNNVGLLRKASRYLRTFKDRWCLADQLEKIKTLVIEAGERRKRYNLDQCIPSTTRRTIDDPRLSALYKKSEKLVGIDNQKEEIVRWVMSEEQKLKVMSIVGFGGLGKTTLANEVFREVGEKFTCKAIISISQNPDIKKLLNILMSRLGLQQYSNAYEEKDLIDRIVAHLQDKRYFIIIDDLWDKRSWNTISCAFPENNLFSRVIITTRIEDVAKVCYENHGFIHSMKPLSEQDSRKLFFSGIYESEDACPPDFIEVSCKILRKCGGLPLAITTMASMIACQPTRSKGQWAEYIENSLDDEFGTNPTYEDMIHILDFSYRNLPYHLKACFLYLGTYPEDHQIGRFDLVRQWVAEGFICCSGRHDVWDVAETYFSELVNRNMIQPAYYDDYTNDMVTHCRVHDMMLELILSKCKEDNFIKLIDAPEMMLEEQEKTIRRLTIDSRRGAESGITVVANAKNLSQVRSLSIFRGNCLRIPNLKEFKFIRLLFLHVSNFEMTIDLSCMNHLSQLRYLKVIGRCGKLPAQIQGLQLLETLDLSGMSYYCGLQEITDVPRLSHISVQWSEGVRLPDGIGKAKSLLTLSDFSLPTSSLKSIMDLGKLTSLSKLSLNYWEKDSRGMMPSSTMIAALITSLEKLSNLKKLTLSAGIHSS